MTRVTIVSGLNGKTPAAVLVEIRGYRILLDLGMGPTPGELPDVAGIPAPDAIFLSHAHEDHIGGLWLRARWGHPPVYASAATWSRIPFSAVPQQDRRRLAESGKGHIGPLPVITGRSGHAPGGIWLHFPHGQGLTYTGDWSLESRLIPFDYPPAAAILLTDASYGDRDECLASQQQHFLAALERGAVVPLPAGGRAADVALFLLEKGLRPRLCPEVREDIRLQRDTADRALRPLLASLLAMQPPGTDWPSDQVILCCDASGQRGLAAELMTQPGFRFIFSSHVAPGTPAAALLGAEQATWLPWNVHPRLTQVVMLADLTAARRVVPLFVNRQQCARLEARLGGRACWQAELSF